MNDSSAAIVSLATGLAFLAFSCAPSDEYDTPPPYQSSYGGAGGDPIYDTPPAYGDGATDPNLPSAGGREPGLPMDPGLAGDPGLPEDPGSAPGVTAVPVQPDVQAATVHTVVRGDTLSGISKRYGVSMDSIRRANRMTGDVVVLGRKMIIPAR